MYCHIHVHAVCLVGYSIEMSENMSPRLYELGLCCCCFFRLNKAFCRCICVSAELYACMWWNWKLNLDYFDFSIVFAINEYTHVSNHHHTCAYVLYISLLFATNSRTHPNFVWKWGFLPLILHIYFEDLKYYSFLPLPIITYHMMCVTDNTDRFKCPFIFS